MGSAFIFTSLWENGSANVNDKKAAQFGKRINFFQVIRLLFSAALNLNSNSFPKKFGVFCFQISFFLGHRVFSVKLL